MSKRATYYFAAFDVDAGVHAKAYVTATSLKAAQEFLTPREGGARWGLLGIDRSERSPIATYRVEENA